MKNGVEEDNGMTKPNTYSNSKTTNAQLRTVDEYIMSFPANVRPVLQKLRETVHEAAPEAEETISYQMPAFRQNGVLVYFGGFKNHIGFYPTPSGTENFQQELSPYKAGKGSIRFPLNKPLPYDLVKKIVKFRLKENSSKKEY